MKKKTSRYMRSTAARNQFRAKNTEISIVRRIFRACSAIHARTRTHHIHLRGGCRYKATAGAAEVGWERKADTSVMSDSKLCH